MSLNYTKSQFQCYLEILHRIDGSERAVQFIIPEEYNQNLKYASGLAKQLLKAQGYHVITIEFANRKLFSLKLFIDLLIDEIIIRTQNFFENDRDFLKKIINSTASYYHFSS